MLVSTDYPTLGLEGLPNCVTQEHANNAANCQGLTFSTRVCTAF